MRSLSAILLGRSPSGLVFRIVSVILLIACFVGVHWYKSNQHKCPKCNVILISIDTLRADHLSSYGYHRATSPNVDLFAKDSVRFTTAISQGPSTAVSHASILTAVLPSVHGAFVTRKTSIEVDIPTIAEILSARKFATASFNGGAQLNRAYGFSRGFDEYKSFEGADYVKENFSDRVKESISWLDRVKSRQFFLFLHTYEVHHPYAPPDKYVKEFGGDYLGGVPNIVTPKFLKRFNESSMRNSKVDRQHIIDMYDGEIRSMDDGFAVLIEYLRSNDLYDNSIIIFTSDHGEEFGEHGMVGYHSHTLYDELLHVPLIIKFPRSKFAGNVVTHQVRSLDIVPTVLDVLDIDPLSHYQGKSLTSAIRGGDFDVFAYSQRDSRHTQLPTSVRTPQWKAMRGKLFNLMKDAKEQVNLVEQQPEIYNEYKKRIDAVLSNQHAKPEDGQSAPDSDVVEQLKTLGYLQ